MFFANDLRFFCREQAKKFASSSVSALNVPLPLTYKKYTFPMENGDDSLKVTNSDATVSTTAPYTGMSIDVFGAGQGRTIGGVSYNFTIIIDGNNGTAEQIYELMLELNEKSSTALVMVTHDHELAAKMDRVLTLVDGELIEQRA